MRLRKFGNFVQRKIFCPYFGNICTFNSQTDIYMNINFTYFAPWEHRKDVAPPSTFFPAGSFHEMDPVRSRDRQAVRMSSHFLAVCYFQHFVHVDAGLRHCVRLQHTTIASVKVMYIHISVTYFTMRELWNYEYIMRGLGIK